MGIFKFNRIPKHQKFNYIPRYYDAAKEDLEERVRIASGQASDPEVAKARIKSGLRRRYSGKMEDTRAATRKSNIRLLLIIGILAMGAYLFLQSPSVQRMVEAFTQ